MYFSFTELTDEVGERLCQAGGEFGVTTGRPRRTGWYDCVIARYASRINGLTDLVMTVGCVECLGKNSCLCCL